MVDTGAKSDCMTLCYRIVPVITGVDADHVLHRADYCMSKGYSAKEQKAWRSTKQNLCVAIINEIDTSEETELTTNYIRWV